MSHTVQKGSDERHAANFHFRNEAVGNAQTEHERQHVEITRMIGGVNFCARRFHVLLANDTYAASDEGEEDFESGRGETSRFSVILDELHHHPGGNDPKQKRKEKVHTVQNLEPELNARKDLAAEVAQGSPRSQAHNLQPRG